MSNNELNLTICSVSFNSEPFLELNWKLVTHLNKRYYWRWIIVDNTEGVLQEKFKVKDERCIIINGMPSDTTKPIWCRGSYHHASALNKVLDYIQTRFALFIDPDFYIVRREWINDVISYMIKNDIGFFGVPWHPRWHGKYRYFPCVHCLFIDLNKVPIQSIDFTPNQISNTDQKNVYMESLKQKIPRYIRYAFQIIISMIKSGVMLHHRKSIGSSKDTGYSLFQKYSQNGKVRHECVAPVFRPQIDFQVPMPVFYWSYRFIEKLLPDNLSYIPKRPGYYTQTSFHDLGYPNVSDIGGEEFFWQGKPFGFHIRCNLQPKDSLKEKETLLSGIVDSFINGVR